MTSKKNIPQVSLAPTASVVGVSETQLQQVEQAVADVTEAEQIEYITVTLPKGTKVTKSKRTIIAPPHATTANKERWFETKRLKSYKVEGGLVTITLAKHMLGYRDMLPDDQS